MTGVDATCIADRLAAASLEGAVVVAIVWIALRLMPSLSPRVRSVLWWVAALKFVIGVLPLPGLSVPLLPAALRPHVAAHPAAAIDDGRRAEMGRGISGARFPPAAELSPPTAQQRHPDAAALPANRPGTRRDDNGAATVAWGSIAAIAWFAVLLVHGIRIAGAVRQIRRLVARAVPWTREEHAMVLPLSQRLGLHRVPDIRTSAEVDAPQVVGIVHPVILVPPGHFTPDERAMVLCHELMHVRRRDLAWGWIPAAAERLFFFHPFAHLAGREYLIAREAACDAAVVRTLGVAASDYARLLVRFGVSPEQPAFVAGGSSPSLSSLRRRLEMLRIDSGTRHQRSAWVIVFAVSALLPLQLGARNAPQRPVESARAAAPAAAEKPASRASYAGPARQVQRAPAARPEPAAAAPQASEARDVARVVQRREVVRAPQADAQREIEQSLQDRQSTIADLPLLDWPAYVRQTQESLRVLAEETRTAGEVARAVQRQDAVRVPQGQETVDAQREIERTLQELTDEYNRALAEVQARADDERSRVAAERAARAEAQQATAREAIRQQLERAEQDARAEQRARAARELDEQLAKARASLAAIEQKGLSDAHPDLLRARRLVAELEEVERSARAARDVEARVRERETTTFLRDQLANLRQQQEALVQQLQRIAEQQQALLEAQRRLSEEAERIRKEFER